MYKKIILSALLVNMSHATITLTSSAFATKIAAARLAANAKASSAWQTATKTTARKAGFTHGVFSLGFGANSAISEPNCSNSRRNFITGVMSPTYILFLAVKVPTENALKTLKILPENK